MARRLLIATNTWSGGDRRWIDQYGIVRDVRVGSRFPGGPSTLTCNLDMPAVDAPLAVLAGRKVEVFNGATRCWAGRLDDPKRGQPWQLAAVGLGSLATSYSAVGSSLDTAVDNAITRGLPWTRPASLGLVSTVGDGSQNLDQALTDAATAAGKAWTVSPDGALTAPTWPAVTTHLAYPANPPETAMSDYYTAAVVTYQSTTSSTGTTTVTLAAAVARYGYVEKRLDLTSLGVISQANAQAYATNWLTRQSPTLTFTAPIVVAPGQLLTVGGAPVDLLSVRAGIRIRVMVTDPGHSALLDPTQAISGVVVETDYDATADTLALSLQGEKRRDLVALLTDARLRQRV